MNNPTQREWDRAVDARMAPGKLRSAAIRETVITEPALHQRYVKASNAPTVTAKPAAVIAEWAEAVDAERAQGKNTAQAIRNVIAKNPQLHKRYIAAANERN